MDGSTFETSQTEGTSSDSTTDEILNTPLHDLELDKDSEVVGFRLRTNIASGLFQHPSFRL